ncbi:hypothetical protein TW81_04910 [Vibrio galatheae]|uniref:O-antigen ligase-related domain-containing protein n=1 Tax=Vibrio galatheae TaxID=579748 RepID=A0A0F4NMR5_9VIBR|nr:O-antigen ligase family protein [Vibrio galatheae]KJY84144.1 hypothetical protein TW81_04910 [Vibrio galatheae]
MKKNIETLFLLSPAFMVFAVIFNVPSTKFIVSRLTVLVCLYCLIFYRKAIGYNFENHRFKFFIKSSCAVIGYFTLLHIARGDDFSFARSLLVTTLYLAMVPWNKIDKKIFVYLILGSALVNSGWSIYEHFTLGHGRVGKSVNPIPYALYCVSMLLCCVYVLRTVLLPVYVKIVAVIASLGCTYALLLTDVRGVWLALPFALLPLFITKVSFNGVTKKNVISLTLAVVVFVGIASTNTVQERWERTTQEFHRISQGDYRTSIGIRLTLWKNSVEMMKAGPIIGIGSDELRNRLDNITDKWARGFAHLHNQYLQILVESGLLGLLIVIVWLASSMVRFNRHGLDFIYHSLCCSILVLFSIASLTDVPFMHGHIVYLISLLLGGALLLDK